MFIISLSPANIAAQVWATAIRQITSVYGGAMQQNASGFGSTVPAGATQDNRTIPNTIKQTTIAIQAGSAGQVLYGLYDGVNFISTILASSAQPAVMPTFTSLNSQGLALHNNDATNAASYMSCDIVWH